MSHQIYEKNLQQRKHKLQLKEGLTPKERINTENKIILKYSIMNYPLYCPSALSGSWYLFFLFLDFQWLLSPCFFHVYILDFLNLIHSSPLMSFFWVCLAISGLVVTFLACQC